MKHLLALLLVLAMLLTTLSVLAEEPAPAIVEVKAIAETLEEGQTVTGMRIELPSAVDAGTLSLTTFAVYGYDIIGYYTNDTGEVNQAAAQGKYVFIKFAHGTVPGYSFGKTLQYTGGINHLRDIHLDIRQNANLTLLDGTVIGAAGFTNDGVINVLVDEFIPITYTNPEDGTEVSYRLYIPKGYEAKAEGQEPLPLVLFLHGAGESGYNNISQILGNPSALEFAKPEAQAKHPCFVLAPQKPSSASVTWVENTGTDEEPYYETSFVLKDMKLVIDALCEEYAIDTNRLYCTGLSMGGRGTFSFNVDYPDYFAAMLVIASCDVYTDEQLEPIKDKPMWLLLAENETEERITKMGGVVDQLEKLGVKVERRVGDQAWDGYARGYAANLLAQEQWDAAVANGATLLFTHYVRGTVLPSSHWTWMATYNNEVIRDWLFSQSK